MRSLRGLKPGNTVFVVHQAKRNETERRVEAVPVVKVGRKYGYVAPRFGNQGKFELDTGRSWHKEPYERGNGCGFDVYLREEDWQREQNESRRFRELAVRLCATNAYALKKLPPHVVEAIHKVLDESEVRP